MCNEERSIYEACMPDTQFIRLKEHDSAPLVLGKEHCCFRRLGSPRHGIEEGGCNGRANESPLASPPLPHYSRQHALGFHHGERSISNLILVCLNAWMFM